MPSTFSGIRGSEDASPLYFNHNHYCTRVRVRFITAKRRQLKTLTLNRKVMKPTRSIHYFWRDHLNCANSTRGVTSRKKINFAVRRFHRESMNESSGVKRRGGGCYCFKNSMLSSSPGRPGISDR
jgi:hypothetical protein